MIRILVLAVFVASGWPFKLTHKARSLVLRPAHLPLLAKVPGI